MEVDTPVPIVPPSSLSPSRKRSHDSDAAPAMDKRRALEDEKGDPVAVIATAYRVFNPSDFMPGRLHTVINEEVVATALSLFHDLQRTLGHALEWYHLITMDFACKHEPHDLPAGHACIQDLIGGKNKITHLLTSLDIQVTAHPAGLPIKHLAIDMMLHSGIETWQEMAINHIVGDAVSVSLFHRDTGDVSAHNLGSVILSHFLYDGTKPHGHWAMFCDVCPVQAIDVFTRWYTTIGMQDKRRPMVRMPDFGYECQLAMAAPPDPAQWNGAMRSVLSAVKTQAVKTAYPSTIQALLHMMLCGHKAPNHLLFCRALWEFVSNHLPSASVVEHVLRVSESAWIKLQGIANKWTFAMQKLLTEELGPELGSHIGVCVDMTKKLGALVSNPPAGSQQESVNEMASIQRVTGNCTRILSGLNRVLDDVMRFVTADVPINSEQTLASLQDSSVARADDDQKAEDEDGNESDEEDDGASARGVEMLRSLQDTALTTPPVAILRIDLSAADNASPRAFLWEEDVVPAFSGWPASMEMPNPLPRATMGFLTEQSWYVCRALRSAVDLLSAHEADIRMHADVVCSDMIPSLKSLCISVGTLLDGFRSWLHTTFRMEGISPAAFLRCFSNVYGKATLDLVFRRQPAYCTALFALVTLGSRVLQLALGSQPTSATEIGGLWKQTIHRNTLPVNALCRMMQQTKLFLFPSHEKWWSHALTTGSLQQRIDGQFPSYSSDRPGGLELEVERNTTVMHLYGILLSEDSSADVQSFQSRTPSVRFRDEEGVGQGVYAEFINVACTQVFTDAERFDDWQFCDISGTYGPSPKVSDSSMEPSFAYQVAGFIIALAARKRIKLPFMLHTFFLHPAVRRPTDVSTHADNIDCWTLTLCEYYDLDLAAHLTKLYKLSNADLSAFTFTVNSRHETKLEKPLWSDIPGETVVTRANLDQFVRGMVRFRLFSDGQADAWKQVLVGFQRVIPSASLDALDLSLQNPTSILRFFSGEERCIPDMDRFIKAVSYGPGNQFRDHEVIRWFWEVVRGWGADREEIKRHLLLFWTSTPFVDVYRVDANHPLTIVVSKEAEDQRCDEDDCLPRSATCFRLLYLPTYSSKEVLQRKLEYAVTHHHSSFGMA